MISTFSPIGLITGNGRFLIASDDKNIRRETIVWSKSHKSVLLVCLFVLFNLSGLAQSDGDYRSVSSGDWNVLATWERYNGTAWNTPTALQGYPGQFAGTNAVTIQAGHTISISSSGTINSPANGTMGSLVINGSLKILNEVDTNFNAYLFIVTPGSGQIIFDLKGSITLPNNATLIVTHGPPEGIIGQSNNTEITVGSSTYHYNGNPKISQLLDQGGANYITFSLSPTSRCDPGSFSISATANPSAGATLNWYTVPSLGTSFFTGSTYITPVLSATAIYYVEAVYATYTTPRLPVTVMVSSNLPNNPGAISGLASQCPNLTGATYSVIADPNVLTYIWSVIGTGWAITAGQNTNVITVKTGTGDGNISVSASNGCSPPNSSPSTFYVTTNTAAAPLLSTVTQPTCITSTGSFSISNYDAGYIYTANPSTGVTIAGNLITAPPGTYTISAKLGSCTSIPSSIITVNPQPISPSAVTVSGAGTFCGSTVITASGGAGGIIYFQGTTSGGTSIAIASQSQSVNNSGTYYFRSLSSSGCWGQEGSVTVVINSFPVINTQPSSIIDCEGHIVSFKVIASGSGLVYTWQRKKITDISFLDIPSSGELNVSYPSPGTIRLENVGNSDAPDGTQYRVLITNSDNCTIISNPAILTVNEIVQVTLPKYKTICEGNDHSYTVTTSYPLNEVSYQWKKHTGPLQWDNVIDGGPISGANTNRLVFTGATPSESGEYKVTVVFHSSGADCNVTSDTRIRTFTVNPKPAISGTLAIGTGSTTQLTGSGTAANTNPWISANPAAATVDNTGLVTGVAAGTSKITYTDSNGCSSDATVSVSGTADVEVTKTAITSIAPGAWMTYTITITNHGLATAPQITLTDNLPVLLLNPQYSINSSGIWNDWTGTIDILNLPNTGIETILIKAKVDCSANGSISNTASVVLSPITDSNPANNTFTVSTPVSGSPPAISAVPTSVSCSGLADGIINLTVSEGTPFSIAPFYTYSWTGPESFSSSSEDISGLIAGTYLVSVTDANGCTISDSYTLGTVPDNTPPTFTTPILHAGYCPVDIYQAIYNEDQSDPELDLTFPRPDYYLFGAGNTMLDLTNVADNCALAAHPISWTIDFGNNGSVELSGSGQLSNYGTAIQFPVGDNLITYTVTDAAGKTEVDPVILTVIPRPTITPDF